LIGFCITVKSIGKITKRNNIVIINFFLFRVFYFNGIMVTTIGRTMINNKKISLFKLKISMKFTDFGIANHDILNRSSTNCYFVGKRVSTAFFNNQDILYFIGIFDFFNIFVFKTANKKRSSSKRISSF